MKKTATIPILLVRRHPVILDADLAVFYGVETKQLNQAIKRNIERFPKDFVFRLTSAEKNEVVTNCDHLRNLKFSKNNPLAFTEHGALMASSVLKSPEAVKLSVFIIRAFVKQREALMANSAILKRLAEIDRSLLLHDKALRELYDQLLPLLQPPPVTPKRRIGFSDNEP